jgi:death on curing protein
MTGPDRIEPVWLDAKDALAIHDRQLAEHGGGVGVRDMGMLESALARPVNRWTYGDDDPANLAASYAFGVARNHPFVDGNKRTAWVLARLFLAINRHELRYDKVDATQTMIALAAGELSEEEMADWLRSHIVAESQD